MSIASVNNYIIPPIDVSSIVDFPKDMFHLILRKLNTAKDVIHFGLTNKKLYSFVLTGCQFHVWNFFLVDHFRNLHLNFNSVDESLPIYKHIKITDTNMNIGTCRRQSIDKYLDAITNIVIHNDLIIIGSEKGTIKILNFEDGKEQMALEGHQDAISSLVVNHKNELISGSRDGKIKIWNLETGEQETLYGHQDPVSCKVTYDGRLIASSINDEIKVWDIESRKLVNTYAGYQDTKNSIAVFNNELVTISIIGDYIKICKLENGEELQTFDRNGWDITFIAIHHHQLILGEKGGILKILDLETGKELWRRTLAHKREITCVILYGDKLISTAKDGLIKIWDYKSKRTKELGNLDGHNLNGHTIAINDIAMSKGKLVSCADNGLINIWDFNPRFSSVSPYAQLTIVEDTNPCDRENVPHLVNVDPLPLVNVDVPLLVNEDPTLLVNVDPTLLADLGIVTKEGYSEKLGCRPEHLMLRGIRSLKDLNVICPPSLEIEELIIDVSPINDVMQQQVIANRNRQNLYKLCNQMLEAITVMDQEAKNCGMILYEGNGPWDGLKNKLTDLLTQLNACERTRNAIIQSFTGEAYTAWAKQLNDLIKEFHEVDREHRIVKLRTYLHQEVVLKVWKTLEGQSILTLSDFQAKYDCSLSQLLKMQAFIETHLKLT